MIKQRRHHLGPEVAPQAIFWRPIYYFSSTVTTDLDDLDKFKFISFALNNEVFDLRVYLQHPAMTVTLYLPIELSSIEEIKSKISAVVDVFQLPRSAVAWQRGEELKFGRLKRKSHDRLAENEARLLVLKIAASFEGHVASTSAIIDSVQKYYELSPDDLRKSNTRANEQMWQQILRNVKVHHSGKSSIFSQGWAEKTLDGVKVTNSGLNYLKSIGFSSARKLEFAL